MKYEKLKRILSLLLSVVMVLGSLTITAGAQGEPSINNSASNPGRASGLVGFSGISLDSKEPIRVIVEFVNRPAKVAEALDNSSGLLMFGAGNYEALAEADRMEFYQKLPDIFGLQRARNAPEYTITWEYGVSINGVAMTLPANKVEELLEISSVYAVYPDIEIKLDPSETTNGALTLLPGKASKVTPLSGGTPTYGMDDVREYLGVDRLYNSGVTGEDIIVGVLDTGIDYFHPDLWDAFLTAPPSGSNGQAITVFNPVTGQPQTRFFGWDFIGVDPEFQKHYGNLPRRSPYDPYETSYKEWYGSGYPETTGGNEFYTSHGTHVAGIIAGRGSATGVDAEYFPQLGVAPGAKLIGYRVLGPYGAGLGSSIIKAIDQVALDGCHIANLSLGDTINDPLNPMSIAVNNVILTYGTVFCIATGNSGPNLETIGCPATAALSISVGNVEMSSILSRQNPITLSINGLPETVFILTTHGSEDFLPPTVSGGKYRLKNAMINPPDQNGDYEFLIIPDNNDPADVPGYGKEEDYEALEASGVYVNGKIAVIKRKDGNFLTSNTPISVYQTLTAYNFGAGAVLFVDSQGMASPDSYVKSYYDMLTSFVVPVDSADRILNDLKGNGMKAGITSLGDSVQPGLIASTSSRGPVRRNFSIKPEIIAPGTGIYSTIPVYAANRPTYPNDYSKAYAYHTGTSMAAPTVSGLAALMLSLDKKANGGVIKMKPEEVTARLANTADGVGMMDISSYSVHEVGSGRPHIGKAIDAGVYATVEVDDVAQRVGSTGSWTYKKVKGNISSFSFGPFSVGRESDKTLTATLTNKGASSKIFLITYEWNYAGQGVAGATAHKPKLTLSTSSITVPGKSTASFTATMAVTALADQNDEGSHEGYVFLTNADDPSEVYRLPFAAQLIPKPNVKDPHIVEVSPSGEGVSQSERELVIKFDKKMDTDVYGDIDGVDVKNNPIWSDDGKVITYTMQALEYGSTYPLYIYGFKDTEGYEMDADGSWWFVVEDAKAIVKFISDGVVYTERKVDKGSPLGSNWPGNPRNKSGYLFEGWFDSAGKMYNSGTVIYGDVLLYASWTYTGNEGRGGGGDSDGTPQEPASNPSANKNISDSIWQALTDNEKKLVWTMGNETSVELSGDDIKRLIDGEITLIVISGVWSGEIKPEFWSQLDLTGLPNAEINLVPLDGDGGNGPGDGRNSDSTRLNGELRNYTCDITIMIDGKEVKKFSIPIKLSVDLSGIDVSNEQAGKLTLIRLRPDGGSDYLGDRYNPDNHILSTEITALSRFGVIYAPDIQKLSMSLNSPAYTINGASKTMDTSPVIINGRTMVPARFFAESFGAQVGWDGESRTVTISLDGKNLLVTIGRLSPGMDAAPQLINDRTMIPLRYISENLGVNVIYDEATKEIRAYK